MSKIIINDLTEIENLSSKSMARIQGGMSYPVEPDGGTGAASPSPVPEFFLPFDIYKLRDEMYARTGTVPSIPEIRIGADPLGSPY